jgi:ATP-dependent DNA helicase RecG
VATSEGLLQRRRLMADGTPQAVPFYPHEFIQRQSTLGLVDQTALAVTEATTAALNPLERERLRQMITRYGGDQSLLPLSDSELDGAMGFVTTIDGVKVPTIAGLLALGREEALRRFVPA